QVRLARLGTGWACVKVTEPRERRALMRAHNPATPGSGHSLRRMNGSARVPRWLVVVAAMVLTGCWWQEAHNRQPPRVGGDEVAVLAGDHPAEWRVEVARGEGGRWCVQGAFGPDPQSAGDPCNQFLGPAGVEADD